ncbi:MAG: GHMP kinase [Myxococcota bacterium]
MTTDASDEHFVPGRLCLFGEHSDWAAGYRSAHPEIARGVCVVAGTERGVRVRATPAEGSLIVSSRVAGQAQCEPWQIPWREAELVAAAGSDHFLRYVAGAAAEFEARCSGRGATLSFTSNLPAQKGLSSSAAVCVATLRGLAEIAGRSLSREEEMEWAYLGERRTGSACGRLDPIVAYGRVVSRVDFDGDDVAIGFPEVATPVPLVVVDLGRSKDTPRILADLHRCYPDAPDPQARAVREALGAANQATVAGALRALAAGDLETLGKLMTEAQARFDRDVVPASTALEAPHQQRVLAHPALAELGFGAKGVGSQGDGCVQVVARDAETQATLVARLGDERGLSAFAMTVPATDRRPHPAPDESA